LEKEGCGLSPSPEASSSVFEDTESFQGREDKKYSREQKYQIFR